MDNSNKKGSFVTKTGVGSSGTTAQSHRNEPGNESEYTVLFAGVRLLTQATFRELAGRNVTVILVADNEKEMEENLEILTKGVDSQRPRDLRRRREHAMHIDQHICDTSSEQVQQLYDFLKRSYKRVDVFASEAGTVPGCGTSGVYEWKFRLLYQNFIKSLIAAKEISIWHMNASRRREQEAIFSYGVEKNMEEILFAAIDDLVPGVVDETHEECILERDAEITAASQAMMAKAQKLDSFGGI